MKPAELILRCYGERDEDGSWFGICIDLNVYVRADNVNEMHEKLHERIAEYIREAVTIDAPYANQLLRRRAPLYFWIRYYWLSLQFAMHSAREGWLTFKKPLPLVPAC